MLKLSTTLLLFFIASNALAIDLYPKNSCDQLSKHTYYTTCYSKDHRQAMWTFHKLEEESIDGSVSRTNNFRRDPNIDYPVDNTAYRYTGFDRGHLVPAGDMKLNYIAMSESFYMSNMSPQRPGFNRGIWRALEMGIRNMTLKLGEAYIVTAPVLEAGLTRLFSGISIPNSFYKIAYFPKAKIMRAYLIENQSQRGRNFREFQVTVNQLELMTGIDFFSSLEENFQEDLESRIQ